jgi:hypothetical protein
MLNTITAIAIAVVLLLLIGVAIAFVTNRVIVAFGIERTRLFRWSVRDGVSSPPAWLSFSAQRQRARLRVRSTRWAQSPRSLWTPVSGAPSPDRRREPRRTSLAPHIEGWHNR